MYNSLAWCHFISTVHVAIVQNTGAGVASAHSSWCDGVNDGMCVVSWPPEKAKDQTSLYAIVTVFGSAL